MKTKFVFVNIIRVGEQARSVKTSNSIYDLMSLKDTNLKLAPAITKIINIS
jgi:hypothetical protein